MNSGSRAFGSSPAAELLPLLPAAIGCHSTCTVKKNPPVPLLQCQSRHLYGQYRNEAGLRAIPQHRSGVFAKSDLELAYVDPNFVKHMSLPTTASNQRDVKIKIKIKYREGQIVLIHGHPRRAAHLSHTLLLVPPTPRDLPHVVKVPARPNKCGTSHAGCRIPVW